MPAASCLVERLFQIGNQVIAALDADRQPDQIVGDRAGVAFNDLAMFSKALDTAKRCCRQEYLERADKPASFRHAALHTYGHHGPEAVHLASRDFMMGV